MAIGSGLGSQLGFITESTWGTRVAPTTFVRARSYNLTRPANRVQGEGIQTGVMQPQSAHYVETTAAGEGSVDLDIQTIGMGPLFQALTGGTSTITQQGTSAAWLQVHTLGDPVKSLTMQLGAPYRTGTVACHEISGAKITSAEFSCAADGLLEGSFSLDAKSWDASQTLATASYGAGAAPFHGKQMTVKEGAFGSETALPGVRSLSLSWNNALDTEDYTAGGGGAKAEQIRNGMVEISGNMTLDWLTTTKSRVQDILVANTPTNLVFKWTGALIASTFYYDLEFVLPGVYFTGDPVGVSGPDALTMDVGFECKFDGTNLPAIKYISTTATSIG